jgi:hypothetical protein
MEMRELKTGREYGYGGRGHPRDHDDQHGDGTSILVITIVARLCLAPPDGGGPAHG